MRASFLLIFCFVALAFASDSKYAIRSDEFRLGEELRLNALMAIGEPGQKILSGKPDFSKKAELYMRRKIDGTNYAFYSGLLNPSPFKTFYAFDLEKNKITRDEALKMKFYAKRRTKPYRDETEIYFTDKYIFSPRLPVLYFMRNEEWQRLESVVAPGVLNIVSDEKKVLLTTETEKDVSLPKRYFPIESGIFYADFSAEGYLPLTEAIDVQPNKQNTLRINLMEAKVSEVSFYPDVYENQISEADSIEKVERLYDLFRKESLSVADTLSTKWFEQVYPSIRILKDTTSEKYRAYAKAYKQTKEKALALWLKARMAPVDSMRTLLFKKLEEFESKPVSFMVQPTSLKIFRSKSAPAVDTTAKKDSIAQAVKDTTVKDTLAKAEPSKPALPPMDSIALHLEGDNGRISVDWVGSLEKGDLDGMVEKLKVGEVQIRVSLDKNNPAWIIDSNVVKSRQHYRFVKIEFVIGAVALAGKGHFVLSETLKKETEVEAWLNPKKAEEPKKEETPVALKDSLKQEESPLKMDSLRREYLVLDSSSFRFRGKIVGISGFAIQTREVTQGDFARMILAKKLDVKMKDRSKFKGENKPVQNITWLDAQAYCKALGGNLPTESQWEYAARAGGNDGFVWESLEKGKPENYAIYEKNSGDLSSKDSAYGPQNVGSKWPNAWGIYDMAGNVAEWTLDNYSTWNFAPDDVDPTGSWMGYTKIIKGGSFDDGIKKLNATSRDDEDPRYWSEEVGFRCVFPVR